MSLECLQPLGGPRAHAGRPGDWPTWGLARRPEVTPHRHSQNLPGKRCPGTSHVSGQSRGGVEGAHPGGPRGLLGGGCRGQQSEPARRPTEAPQGGSGVALRRRVGSRGGVCGAGLGDMGVECWAGPDGEGRSSGRGRWGKGRAARRSSWGHARHWEPRRVSPITPRAPAPVQLFSFLGRSGSAGSPDRPRGGASGRTDPLVESDSAG